MADRTPEQYAIEHGEYLATAAAHFMDKLNDLMHAREALNLCDGDDADLHAGLEQVIQNAEEDVSDHWGALESAIYEFRKRAARAGHQPSADKIPR